MKIYIKILALSIIVLNVSAQDYSGYGEIDTSLVHIGKEFEGYWALEEISDGNHQIRPGFHGYYSCLRIEFIDSNKYILIAGNSYWGRYYITDENEIKFKNFMGTCAASYVRYKNGYGYSPDQFADSLQICNRYKEEDNRLKLFCNDRLVLTLKRYRDFFTFPERTDMVRLNFETFKIDTIALKSKYVLITDSSQLDKYNLILIDTFDFSKNSLIIVRNDILKKNKKVLRQLHWRQRLKKIDKNKYPVHYSNFYYDPVEQEYYLDIVRSYYGNRDFSAERFPYTGYLIEKVSEEDLNIKMKDRL